MKNNELKNGPWKLSDLENIPKNGLKVFSCFHCGGGSTMGYKLAGYDVLGGIEIDEKMMTIYKTNHNPKYSYLMSVQDFKKIPNNELSQDLFELDILDGSPPCSVFSMAGLREDKWGIRTHFREGQSEQVLDDLFFHFIDIAEKLNPKVVIAENVKGLIQGNAKGYVKEIFKKFEKIGFDCQLFLLNSATMGVPQRRERVFFIANRLSKKINLNFNEKQIPFGSIKPEKITYSCNVPDKAKILWKNCLPGKNFSSVHPKGNSFNSIKVKKCEPVPTIAASYGQGSWAGLFHYLEPRQLTIEEYLQCQTFPDDFNFLNEKPVYILGMSVPPFMMQRLSREIATQFFGK
jgi:DNA (cytosine-5)-methyltransferase 1